MYNDSVDSVYSMTVYVCGLNITVEYIANYNKIPTAARVQLPGNRRYAWSCVKWFLPVCVCVCVLVYSTVPIYECGGAKKTTVRPTDRPSDGRRPFFLETVSVSPRRRRLTRTQCEEDVTVVNNARRVRCVRRCGVSIGTGAQNIGA